jgi:DNA-binding response OmpR family regulator
MPFAASPRQLRYQRILAVDSKAACEELQSLLEGKNFICTCSNDGIDALRIFREGFFDLVLTDLALPSLDGMHLLSAIKEINPRVPVIIISGQGDAATVVSCLKCGAENFLTKPLQQDMLLKVIDQALSISASRFGKHIFEGKARQVTCLQCSSRPELIKEIIFLIAQSAITINFAENDLDNNIKLALVEAITNAMEHGHKWDESKMVDITIDIDYDQLKVTIQDCGPGFDVNAVSNPTEQEHLFSERGRGIFLMQAIMDDVRFNEIGNRITLVRQRAQIQ